MYNMNSKYNTLYIYSHKLVSIKKLYSNLHIVRQLFHCQPTRSLCLLVAWGFFFTTLKYNWPNFNSHVFFILTFTHQATMCRVPFCAILCLIPFCALCHFVLVPFCAFAVLCLMLFCALCRFVLVPFCACAVLCPVLFCALCRFVLVPFCACAVLSLCRFVMCRFVLVPFRDVPFCMCIITIAVLPAAP